MSRRSAPRAEPSPGGERVLHRATLRSDYPANENMLVTPPDVRYCITSSGSPDISGPQMLMGPAIFRNNLGDPSMQENVTREFFDKSVESVKDTYEKTQAAAQEATKVMERTFSPPRRAPRILIFICLRSPRRI
jgi:hypothetical protein